MKKLSIFMAVIAGLYAAVTVFIYTQQRKLLYFPPSAYLTPAGAGVESMQEYPIRIDDGTALTAWWSPPQSETAKTVMVFHGNGSAVFSNQLIYNDLMAAGHGVWGVAYPGYPGSKGTPSQAAIVKAAIAQYDVLRGEGVSQSDIVFYGTSLGTGVAAQLSRQRKPSLLILDAPFNSTLDVAKKQMPFLPVSLLMKDSYRSDLALADQTFPIIWIHGTDDRVISISHGQKLFDAYAGPKQSHIIDGGQHMNLWSLGGREITLDALTR